VRACGVHAGGMIRGLGMCVRVYVFGAVQTAVMPNIICKQSALSGIVPKFLFAPFASRLFASRLQRTYPCALPVSGPPPVPHTRYIPKHPPASDWRALLDVVRQDPSLEIHAPSVRAP
jgi:hypothetical protein